MRDGPPFSLVEEKYVPLGDRLHSAARGGFEPNGHNAWFGGRDGVLVQIVNEIDEKKRVHIRTYQPLRDSSAAICSANVLLPADFLNDSCFFPPFEDALAPILAPTRQTRRLKM